MQRTPTKQPEPLISMTALRAEWKTVEKLIAVYQKQCKAMRYESPMLGLLDQFQQRLICLRSPEKGGRQL